MLNSTVFLNDIHCWLTITACRLT